jgi:hypothetical protein
MLWRPSQLVGAASPPFHLVPSRPRLSPRPRSSALPAITHPRRTSFVAPFSYPEPGHALESTLSPSSSLIYSLVILDPQILRHTTTHPRILLPTTTNTQTISISHSAHRQAEPHSHQCCPVAPCSLARPIRPGSIESPTNTKVALRQRNI